MKKIMITASAFLFSMALTTGAMAAGEYGSGAQTSPGVSATQQQGQFNVKSTDDLVGLSVMGQQDEEIGSISDLLVDAQTGQLAFAIVSAGGVLGVGGDQYIVPWNALQISPEAEDARVNISSDRLQEAPTGDSVADRQEAEQIHQFYGVSPYWEDQQMQSPMMRDQQQDMMMDQQQQQQQDEPMMR
jgi:sporulation protein YlmC with PRC-barrel domain